MFWIPSVAIQAKNNADGIITLLCCEKKRCVSGCTCFVHVMVLLHDGDFTSSKSSVFVYFFQEEKTLAGSEELRALV